MKKALFALLALSLFISVANAAIPPLTSGMDVRSQRSLRQQVDSYAELLQKEVIKARNNRERFKAMEQALVQIKTLRDNGAPQAAFDDAHMDLVVTVLESIPKEGEFRKSLCLRYENDLINQFEPTADEAPQESAVVPGWNVLQSLCN